MVKQTEKVKTGHKIRALHIEYNLSPDMPKISESTYRKYETGKNYPSLDLLNKIAKIYNREIVDLLPDSCLYQENKDNAIGVGINEGVINHLSDKIIELYENQISDLKRTNTGT